jgi:hypothetical protein
MPKPKPPAKCSLLNHFIYPLLAFAVGMTIASTFTGDLTKCEPTDASDARIVTLMGRVNDLEDLLSSATSTIEHQKGQCDKKVIQIRTLLEEEKTKSRDSELLKAMPGASGPPEEPQKCPPCPECDAEFSTDGDMAREVAEEAAWAARVAERGGSDAVKDWTKISKAWKVTEMDPLSFLSVFDIGLPTETIKWSGGYLMLPNSKETKAAAATKQLTAAQTVQQQCTELDVVVLNDRHCVAVTHVNGAAAGHNTPYHINRVLKGGYRLTGRRALAAAASASSSASSNAAMGGWELVSRLTTPKGGNEGAPPGPSTTKTHRKALQRFLASIDDVEAQLTPVLKQVRDDWKQSSSSSSSSSSLMIIRIAKRSTPFVCLFRFVRLSFIRDV